ncbi:class I SAM-dependent RNA methyltransferase [Bifidobacterium aquikefiricola]|uniref:RNA methyltransferase n=1 Tax=Bifidobacterium aquikefiricola TaxID=3059038 RepID=A0AB39U4P1_9BIFI
MGFETQLRIERYADQGRCVGHIDGRVVFVRFALPGELVRIVLDEPHERTDRFWTGEVIEVIEPSSYRVEPAWKLAGPLCDGGGVGGADLVHVSLPGQLVWKSDTINEQMKRLGHVDTDVEVIRMPEDEELGGLHWRTRVEMIADEDGRPSMRRRGTHRRVTLDTMPLATASVLKVAEDTHFWDGGFTPGAQLRIAVPEAMQTADDGESAKDRESANSDGSEDKASAADFQNYAVMVDGELTAGEFLLKEQVKVDDRTWNYRVNADGFWQVHRKAPRVLASEVLHAAQRALDGSDAACIWDLYSGAGLFTIPLATMTSERTSMLSIEGAKPAVINARRNLRSLGISRVDARIGDVGAVLGNVPSHLSRPDVVVLDPPRAGARRKVCERIAAANPKAIIYVACDPTSLARDTATLDAAGYKLSDLSAYDIYPMTHHVESLAVFTR